MTSKLFQFLVVESDLAEYRLTEAETVDADGWTNVTTKFYSKNFKIFSRDKVVMSALKQLVDFIKSQDHKPQIKEYPTQFYVHAIKMDNKFKRPYLQAHLKGQKIIVVFNVDYETKTIDWLGIGTHQDIGWR